MKLFEKSVSKTPRFRIKKGYPGIKAAYYRFTNQAYLDMSIYRGYRRLHRIVTKDTGFERFTVETVGTFVMPTEDEILHQFHTKNALFLSWNIKHCNPAIPVDNTEWIKYEYPPMSPEEFQKQLEAQTVSDLLSESETNYTMLFYLIIAGLALFLIVMMFRGA